MCQFLRYAMVPANVLTGWTAFRRWTEFHAVPYPIRPKYSEAVIWAETARAPPPLLLPEDTEGNPPGFGGDEANLFLVVVNHEIVVDDRAVGSGTLERPVQSAFTV